MSILLTGACLVGGACFVAWLVNLILNNCFKQVKASPLPVEVPASVSAAEFLEQAKAQRAERETKAPALVVKPEAPKKRSNRPAAFILCAVFALGGIVGGAGGYAVSNRYQLVGSNGAHSYRIDRLTSQTWLVAGDVSIPVKERSK